jgi:hypothetical protein
MAALRPVVRDAPLVAALRETGALLLGKTAMVEHGLSAMGLNTAAGTPRNPYNPSHLTGGSSSGSAAAVAAGLCPFAIGARPRPACARRDCRAPAACASARLPLLGARARMSAGLCISEMHASTALRLRRGRAARPPRTSFPQPDVLCPTTRLRVHACALHQFRRSPAPEAQRSTARTRAN